jgi:hypothetical protein
MLLVTESKDTRDMAQLTFGRTNLAVAEYDFA